MQNTPLWRDSSAEPELARAEILDRCDVAIVGGGYTGLSTALHCAQAGLSVQLCEAQQVGHGGSGRNVGLVNAGLWLPPSKLLASMGAHGPAFLDLFGDGPRRVFDLIERHQIRCAPRRAGTIHAAHAPSGMADLEQRHADWSARGAPVTLMDADQVAQATGSAAFAGGLVDSRAGTVNPMGYARGLARVAQAQGARIAEKTRVSGLRRDAGGWVVTTPAGDVQARAVVLAANAYSDALWPGLARGWSVIHFMQIATEPLGARAEAILPGGQGLWDTGMVMRSLRKEADGRLVLGTMGRNLGLVSRVWAARRLRRWFPDLGQVRFGHAWHGKIAMTPDHLPRIAELEEGLYAPLGYNGRGITTGTLFGAALADMLAGGDPAALPLPLEPVAPVRFKRAQEGFYDLAFLAKQLL